MVSRLFGDVHKNFIKFTELYGHRFNCTSKSCVDNLHPFLQFEMSISPFFAYYFPTEFYLGEFHSSSGVFS